MRPVFFSFFRFVFLVILLFLQLTLDTYVESIVMEHGKLSDGPSSRCALLSFLYIYSNMYTLSFHHHHLLPLARFFSLLLFIFSGLSSPSPARRSPIEWRRKRRGTFDSSCQHAQADSATHWRPQTTANFKNILYTFYTIKLQSSSSSFYIWQQQHNNNTDECI